MEVGGGVGNTRHQPRQDERHQQQGQRSVARFGRPEGSHAVRNRLHARQRGAAPRERRQDDQQAERLRALAIRRVRRRLNIARKAARQPHQDQNREGQHEPVGRRREHQARLARPAQVNQRHQRDKQDAQRHAIGQHRRERRDNRVHACRDAHRYGQHIADQQRRRRQHAPKLAQILARHDKRAAALWVGVHRLPIGEHHDKQQRDDRQRDGERQAQRLLARRPQHQHHLFGRVGGGRKRVGSKHGQSQQHGQAFVPYPPRGKHRSNQ